MSNTSNKDDDLIKSISGYNKKYIKLTANMLAEFVSNSGDDNIFYSPFSVLVLLSIAADSVCGKSREEILDVIGSDVPGVDLRDMIIKLQDTFADGGDLVTANAVCVKERIKGSIRSEYIEKLSDYGGRLFATKDIVKDVNEWIKESTLGMIEKIADDSMDDMLAVLMNAVAFQASWAREYSEDEIYEDVFTSADGTVSEVTFLESRENGYIVDDLFTGFLKRYKHNTYCFMALLPKEEISGKQLSNILKIIDLTKIYESASLRCDVNVEMPEFSSTFEADLMGICKSLGIKTIFTPEADFSPMSSEQLIVDSIRHKAHIEVDRKGTKAAAVTAAWACAGLPKEDDTKYICLNRPFIYSVMNTKTALPVFVGICNRVG